MKTNILFVILTAGLINAGRSSISKSNIFQGFSLQSTVSKMGYKNIDCSKGADGDGMVAEGSAVGRGGTENMQSSSIRCEIIQVENKEFSESDFIDGLLKEVEKEIKSGGGTTTGSSRPGLSNFIVNYEVKGRQGKINVSGKRDGSSYELRAEISEWTK
jgi:hypothetical protein